MSIPVIAFGEAGDRGREGVKLGPLSPVAEDSRGNTLFVQTNGVGGNAYWSDEIGGGVHVWDTSLVSCEMMQLAIDVETNRMRPNLWVVGSTTLMLGAVLGSIITRILM